LDDKGIYLVILDINESYSKVTNGCIDLQTNFQKGEEWTNTKKEIV
jgi:hypothetical protein